MRISKNTKNLCIVISYFCVLLFCLGWSIASLGHEIKTVEHTQLYHEAMPVLTHKSKENVTARNE